jgi:hypothetical protein
MFENKNQPLASPQVFRQRVLLYLLIAAGVTLAWLLVGAFGFYLIAQLHWEDALYNSAMIVSDMGPVFEMNTTASKLFTAVYALASGLVFIAIIGIAFAPIIHRFFHYLHLEEIPGPDELQA